MKAKKRSRNCFVLVWTLVKRFLANSSIHGIKYLVEDGIHWTERLFWIIFCGLSWWGCAILISGVLDDFANRRTAVTVDTNYLNWEAELPSMHMCSEGTSKATTFISQTWGKKYLIGHKVDGTRQFGYESTLREPHDAQTFEKIAELLKLNCSEFFERCEWEGESVDCCKIFKPLPTPIGPCLSVNSILTVLQEKQKEKTPNKEKFLKTRKIQRNIFQIYLTKVTRDFSMYILGRMELPTVKMALNKRLNSKWKTSLTSKIEVRQKPTHNEEGVRSVPIEKRNCRFANENENMKIYSLYAYDACVVEIFLSHMYESCGCISHVYPRPHGVPICNQTQLECVYEIGLTFDENNFPPCLSDCEAIEHTFFESYSDKKSPGGGQIIVNFLPGPTIRYVRYVVHSEIDLVVSVGGALGLFVGASILSLVEIPYWFLVRSVDDDDDDNVGNKLAEN